jgi:hypothetical protein
MYPTPAGAAFLATAEAAAAAAAFAAPALPAGAAIRCRRGSDHHSCGCSSSSSSSNLIRSINLSSYTSSSHSNSSSSLYGHSQRSSRSHTCSRGPQVANPWNRALHHPTSKNRPRWTVSSAAPSVGPLLPWCYCAPPPQAWHPVRHRQRNPRHPRRPATARLATPYPATPRPAAPFPETHPLLLPLAQPAAHYGQPRLRPDLLASRVASPDHPVERVVGAARAGVGAARWREEWHAEAAGRAGTLVSQVGVQLPLKSSGGCVQSGLVLQEKVRGCCAGGVVAGWWLRRRVPQWSCQRAGDRCAGGDIEERTPCCGGRTGRVGRCWQCVV